MKITIHQPLYIFEIGQRANQEDCLYPVGEKATSEDRLFVLCDGMGGHEHGEVASQTVCKALGNWFSDNMAPSQPLTDNQLLAAIEYAYNALDTKDNGGIKKMGTTLTLLYIHRCGVTCAHIGDSRIYHIRPQSSSPSGRLGGAILYQSRDHSLVFDLFQSGEISHEEMATFPQKNIITRAMQPGMNNRARPDIIHITDIRPSDYFFLCSDGMLENMDNRALLKILSSDLSDTEKCEQLVNISQASQDNHSAWLISIKDVMAEPGDETLINEEPTSRYNAVNIIKTRQAEETKQKQAAIATYNDDNDVVMVSTASRPKQPTRNKRLPKILIAALAICTILFLVLSLAWLNLCEPRKLSKPKPMMELIHSKKKPRKADTVKVVTPSAQDSTMRFGVKRDSIIKKDSTIKNAKDKAANKANL